MEWVLRSFEQVLYDPRIKEVIISDDFSDIDTFARLLDCIEGMDKVHLYRNEKNLGCYFNKRRAIELATSEYCIILDSDNFVSTKYIDKLFVQEWNPKKILAPVMGFPSLNYTLFAGVTLTKENVNSYLPVGNLLMCLNTFNFFINRSEYLRLFDDSIEPWTSDSIWFNYCWLAGGNSFHIVDGLSYHHEIHSGSHYQEHNRKAPGFYESVIEKLKALK